MSKSRRRRNTRAQSRAQDRQGEGSGPSHEELMAGDPDLLSFDEMEVLDLSDLELSDEENQWLREEWRREEEAYWAKHGRPPQWRKKPSALIPTECGVAPGERYDARWTESNRQELAAENPDAAIRPVWPWVEEQLLSVADLFANDVDRVLGTAVDKLGSPKWARAFNVDLERTCLKRRGKDQRVATPVCADRCYVATFAKEYKRYLKRAARNYDLSRSRSFVDLICAAILRRRTRLLRIHSVGDFYSAAYIRKWVKIAKQNPWTEFLAYTRAWRLPEMVEALRELAAVDNVSLWLSTDRMSGAPPIIENTRICFLADTDGDSPACLGKRVLPRVKLVFRASARRNSVPLAKLDGVKVCPHENGRDVDVTCITCAYCLFQTHRK